MGVSPVYLRQGALRPGAGCPSLAPAVCLHNPRAGKGFVPLMAARIAFLRLTQVQILMLKVLLMLPSMLP